MVPTGSTSWRRLRRVLFCLMMGLVTTVLVAWGRVATADFSGAMRTEGSRLTRRGEVGRSRYLIVLTEQSVIGVSYYFSFAIRDHHGNFIDTQQGSTPEEVTRGWADSVVVPLLLRSFETPERDRHPGHIYVEAAGWPWRALWLEYETHSVYDAALRIDARGAWVLADSKVKRAPYKILFPLALPLRPLILGVVADTLFYAVLGGMLLYGPGAIRRRWRSRRRRCISCGYDLAGLGIETPCPECGQ